MAGVRNPPRVYVVGGGSSYIRMFLEMGYAGAKHAQEADLVCFTGGPDINPELYSERPLQQTNWYRDRDDMDLEAYAAACMAGVPMVGICRGGQFLNVMNGGKMWQHVSDHTSVHLISDIAYNETVEVTSTHHQMMIPGPEALILADTNVAKEKYSFGREEFRLDPEGNERPEATRDTEVVWYEDTNCLCFQPHPEIGHMPTFNYFSRVMDDFIYPIL